LRDTGIRQFIFASSSSVYGVNNHIPWKEDEALQPISPYAMSKVSAEMAGRVFSHLHGIRFIALRFFTVYGPGQRPDLAIHKFLKAILSGAPVLLYGNGTTQRDYTYVDDIVQGILAAIDYSGSQYEIINLGNNHPVSLTDLIRTIEDVSGMKATIRELPEQAGDVPVTYADIQKAQKLLHYQPSISLRDGIQNFYDWFMSYKGILLP
jgi:UDP-glucuronate 4-epimerase